MDGFATEKEAKYFKTLIEELLLTVADLEHI